MMARASCGRARTGRFSRQGLERLAVLPARPGGLGPMLTSSRDILRAGPAQRLVRLGLFVGPVESLVGLEVVEQDPQRFGRNGDLSRRGRHHSDAFTNTLRSAARHSSFRCPVTSCFDSRVASALAERDEGMIATRCQRPRSKLSSRSSTTCSSNERFSTTSSGGGVFSDELDDRLRRRCSGLGCGRRLRIPHSGKRRRRRPVRMLAFTARAGAPGAHAQRVGAAAAVPAPARLLIGGRGHEWLPLCSQRT